MDIQTWQKKPVRVQAAQLSKDNVQRLANWCGGLPIVTFNPENEKDIRVGLNIPTLEGVMRASEGDYVIRGVQGEFYPCKPDIFEATYQIPTR